MLSVRSGLRGLLVPILSGRSASRADRGALEGMRTMFLLDEAQRCRRDAEQFKGKAEALVLLRIARAFEELAELSSQLPGIVAGDDAARV